MLGVRIAFARHNLGLSQAELARELNISASALGMYEQGRRNPPQDILVALSQKLHVSTDYLLTGNVSTQADQETLAELLSGSNVKSFCPILFLKETGTILIAINLNR